MSYSKREILSTAGALTALAFTRTAGAAEDAYPSRPIEFVVPWGPGGGADQLARMVGKLAEPIVGQSMPVVNVPGGTGATGMAKLLSAPADGYAAAVYIADSHALLAGSNARWAMGDIMPVAVLLQAPSFLFVAQDSPFKTWADFEAQAKANPGQLKVATLGFGSVDDFTLKYLGSKGTKVLQVPFAKPSERYISILGGHADALFEQAGDVAQFINGKQMRPLVVFAEQRFAAFKDIPCSHELGYQVSLPQFRSIVVRAGTPPEHVQVLAEALAGIAATAEYKAFLQEQFAGENSFLGATEAASFLNEQLEAMRNVSKSS